MNNVTSPKNNVLLQFNISYMDTISSFLQTCKPGIPKRYLLLVAALVWTFAGGMLLFRGFTVLKFNSASIGFEESGCIIAGFFFYKYMFSAISTKHIHRILNIQIEKPCFFSFFNWRSYGLMTIMISAGITLRLSGLVPLNYLSLFYIAMGTPLFISAIRFFYYARKYRNQNNNGVSVS